MVVDLLGAIGASSAQLALASQQRALELERRAMHSVDLFPSHSLSPHHSSASASAAAPPARFPHATGRQPPAPADVLDDMLQLYDV